MLDDDTPADGPFGASPPLVDEFTGPAYTAEESVRVACMVADGLAALAAEENLDSFRLPYPDPVQRALNRVVLAALRRGIDPNQFPQSVMGLVAWCREVPLSEWPLSLPDDRDWNQTLIDRETNERTPLCIRLERRSPYASDRGMHRILMGEFRSQLKSLGLAEGERLRVEHDFEQVMVQFPVLTRAMRFEKAELVLGSIADLMSEFYRPMPSRFLRDGVCRLCERCNLPLYPRAGQEWWCETADCQRRSRHAGKAPKFSRTFSTPTGRDLFLLIRPFRLFVTAPANLARQP
ncbi:hypothetical protein [Marinactinospora rubrisoli]|uniref:pPIWI-RE three-gene island domain-containing protein n=1 Tax=Marinactinospora rubrisoli TaxID=2715399 RepID=A0ABW2KFC1_9ACTN